MLQWLGKQISLSLLSMTEKKTRVKEKVTPQ
jgi:hypothetical protein